MDKERVYKMTWSDRREQKDCISSSLLHLTLFTLPIDPKTNLSSYPSLKLCFFLSHLILFFLRRYEAWMTNEAFKRVSPKPGHWTSTCKRYIALKSTSSNISTQHKKNTEPDIHLPRYDGREDQTAGSSCDIAALLLCHLESPGDVHCRWKRRSIRDARTVGFRQNPGASLVSSWAKWIGKHERIARLSWNGFSEHSRSAHTVILYHNVHHVFSVNYYLRESQIPSFRSWSICEPQSGIRR